MEFDGLRDYKELQEKKENCTMDTWKTELQDAVSYTHLDVYKRQFKGTTTDQIFILENHTDVESLSTRESVASIELPKLNAFLNFDSIRKEMCIRDRCTKWTAPTRTKKLTC